MLDFEVSVQLWWELLRAPVMREVYYLVQVYFLLEVRVVGRVDFDCGVLGFLR